MGRVLESDIRQFKPIHLRKLSTPFRYRGEAWDYPQPQELSPEIMVFNFLPLVLHPAVGPPASGPTFSDAVNHVFRVAVQNNHAPGLQCFQTDDAGGQFHAIIGRQAITSREFLSLLS